MIRRFQPHPHDAMDDQREEADQGVSTDAFRQAVVNWRNLDVALEYAEAALDVGQGLVARDDFLGAELGIGDQQALAIEPLGIAQYGFIALEAEAFRLEVRLEDAAQARVPDLLAKAQVGPPIARFASAQRFARVRIVQPLGHALAFGLDGFDLLASPGRLFGSALGIVGNDQATSLPAADPNPLLDLHYAHQLAKIGIVAGGYGQDVLDVPARAGAQLLHRVNTPLSWRMPFDKLPSGASMTRW